MVKTLFLLASTVFLCNCKGHPTEPDPPADTSMLELAEWRFSSGSALRHPTRDGPGWYFDFPRTGYVDYLYTYCCAEPVVGKTLTVSFYIEAEKAEYAQAVTYADQDINPASLHVFIQKQNDNMQSDFGRFYAGRNELTADGTGIFNISIPLTWKEWSSVFGHHDEKAFAETVSHLGHVGFTFGGYWYAGHGVYLVSGKSRFRLLAFKIG